MILYRGDSKTRQKTLGRNRNLNYWFAIYGNMINGANGGSPFSLLDNDLVELIQKHICPKLDNYSYHNQSDFLSFTEDYNCAKERYLGMEIDAPETNWIGDNINRIIFRLDLQNDYCCLGKGFYKYVYTIDFSNIFKKLQKQNIKYILPTTEEEKKLSGIERTVLLIKLEEYFSYQEYDMNVKSNSIRDKEWLLFPIGENLYKSGEIETRLYPQRQMDLELYV